MAAGRTPPHGSESFLKGPHYLTGPEMAFCAHYAWSLNAAAAVRVSGFDAKRDTYNAIIAKRLLGRRDIQAEIVRVRQEAAARHERAREWMIRELVSMAGADLTDVLTQDADGSVRLKALEDIAPEARATLASIQQSLTTSDKGAQSTLTVKQHSKIQAMQLLARIMGMEAPSTVKHDITGELANHVKTARTALERALFRVSPTLPAKASDSE